jgi:hypothetical protein
MGENNGLRFPEYAGGRPGFGAQLRQMGWVWRILRPFKASA